MMKKAFLSLLIISFVSLSFAKEEDPKLFVLIDINNIMINTIPYANKKPDIAYSEKLQQLGFSIQSFEVPSTKSNDSKFDDFLKKSNQEPREKSESNRLKKLEMFAIRPTIQSFLEALTELKIPTHIIICSKNYTPRTRALINNLNIQINNVLFKDLEDIIQKEQSIVYINYLDGRKITAKSAVEIRKQYNGKFGKIRPIDYLILVDQTPDSQFILYNRDQDLNVQISPFYIPKGYDRDSDIQELNAALEKIKNFTNKK